MAINKVVYGDDTLIDLTQDSVSAENLLEGETAHDRSGVPVTGTAKQGHVIQNSSGISVTQRNTMQFKGMTVTDDANNGKTVVEATKTSVGLGNVPNVTTDNQTPTVTEASARANLATGDTLKTIIGKIKKFFTDIKDLAFIAKDGSTSKYLRGDGTWQIPPNDNTWTAMVGATSSANGSVGYVNAVPPKNGYNTKYLRADGSWQIPPDTDTKKVFFGTCTGQAANQKKTVTISSNQNFTLTTGAIIFVKFDANNTYSATEEAPVQLNVNSSGDKTVYGAGSSALTGTNTTYFGRKNYVNQYIYDGTYWVWTGSSADNNNTYTTQGLGIGYGTCTTAAATAAKAATLSGYALVTNGTVAIKFTNAVPANATLAINGKTAKAIYYRGAAITAGIINAGDTATFFYNGSQYHLIAVDNVEKPTFTEASTRANIASGETLTTILGKIKKWFTDIPSMFVSKSGDTMNGQLNIDRQNGTASTVGGSQIWLGNDISEGTAKNSRGILRLYGKNSFYAEIYDDIGLTAHRSITLPNKSGTLALTDDIPLEFINGEFTGDLNDFRCGLALVSSSTSTNVPDANVGEWIVFSDVKQFSNYLFGFQLAIGRNSNRVYMRRRWSTWGTWLRLDNT